eukprot:GHVS01052504.1.p4 GENE.GHVS01052504.1~~GHVS01052504.1.p4  ORF type:complete len:301 (+),score=61.52 GHVS01052504.1:1505-2407(+)
MYGSNDSNLDRGGSGLIESEGGSLQIVCRQLRQMVRSIRLHGDNYTCGAREATIEANDGVYKRLKVEDGLAALSDGDEGTEQQTGKDEQGGADTPTGCVRRMMADRECCDVAIDDVMRHVRCSGSRSAALSRSIDSCDQLAMNQTERVDLRPLAEWVGGMEQSGKRSIDSSNDNGDADQGDRDSLRESNTQYGGSICLESSGRSFDQLMRRTAKIPERLLEEIEELASVDVQLMAQLAADAGTTSPRGCLEGARRRAEDLLSRQRSVLEQLSSWLDKMTEETDLIGCCRVGRKKRKNVVM